MSKLTLIKDLGMRNIGRQGQKRRYGLYVCECGIIKEINLHAVKSGKTSSCGCYIKESATTHGLSYTKIYNLLRTMKIRCYNVNATHYHRYGGRGIKICEEWLNDVSIFYEWSILNGYKCGLQIDRIDNDGDYTPENCRFVTPQENTRAGRRGTNLNNSTGYTGVSYNKPMKRFSSVITINYKQIVLGYFDTIIEAHECRQKYLEEMGWAL